MKNRKTIYKELNINNIKIPLIVKSFRTSRSIKFFFKNDSLTITKPNYLSEKELEKIIKQNEEYIYTKHLEGLKNKDKSINNWKTGEKIFYEGEEYTVVREENESSKIEVSIEKDKKEFKIYIPYWLEEDKIKELVDKSIKNLFKKNTESLLKDRLTYWNKITGIEYNSFKVRDAKSRYGSCVSKTKDLRFSGRLIMLPKDKVDGIIVHELCHIIHSNHSKNFYEKVNEYISNYKEIDKWLNKNNKMIIF